MELYYLLMLLVLGFSSYVCACQICISHRADVHEILDPENQNKKKNRFQFIYYPILYIDSRIGLDSPRNY